jgi:hypothetical protein
MNTLPAELIMLIVPNPDTLGRMLLVSKWISAALTAGGPFKLTEVENFHVCDDVLTVGNGVVSFVIRFEQPCVICVKVFGRHTEVAKYTFAQICDLVGVPKYIRDTPRNIAYMSGIGWDTVNYAHKCVVAAGGVDDRFYDVARRSRDIVLIRNIKNNISAKFSISYITDDPNDTGGSIHAEGLHLVYKRITQ